MPAPSPTSLIDVVDESDRPVGTIQRGRVLDEGKAFRVSHVWLFSGEDLLLQQLGRHRQRHPLQWGSSAAAYLHHGETYAEAARRRLKEELGVDLRLRCYDTSKMQDGRSTKFIALYIGDVPRPDLPQIQEREHIEALRYWSPAEIRRQLKARPESFTQTFRHLYDLYVAPTGRGAALH